MKHKHMFSLLDQSFTTVHVVFGSCLAHLDELPPGHYSATIEDVQFSEDDAPWTGSKRGKMAMRMRVQDERTRTYVYKVPKAWDVKPDDNLIVLDPTNGLKVVTVVKVDDAPDIDVDANFDYKWAVQRVNLTEFRELTRKEKSFADTMLEVERTKQRESLLASFRESLPEGSEARRLFEQTTASLSGPTIEPMAPPSAPQGQQ